MNVALATCARWPELPSDDVPLRDAFASAGVAATPTVWDDPDVNWAAFDACLVRSTWDYAERRDVFLGWAERVAAEVRLFNDAAILRWNTDKHYMFDLESAGVSIVPTVWIEAGSSADLKGLLAHHRWKEAVIKPAVGATARETIRVARRDPAPGQAHLDRLLPREAMLVQPFLSSILVEGECSLMFVGGRFTHAVRKRAVAGDYRVQDDFGGSIESIRADEPMIALARRAIEASPTPPTYARVDLVRNDCGDHCVMELELTEPMLYFRQAPTAAALLVRSVLE